MPRRNSPHDIADLGGLSGLSDLVFDKRQSQRSSAKRHRRNRHYEKQFIRNVLRLRPADGSGPSPGVVDEPDDPPPAAD